MAQQKAQSAAKGPQNEELVCVGVVGPARGLAGEMLVKPLTDYVEERFEIGEVLTDAQGNEYTVQRVRVINNRLCVTFEEITTRNGAENMRGQELYAEAFDEEDAYTREELTGLRVLDDNGTQLGTVQDLELGDYQDRLLVNTPTGEVLVPFVYELVPEVNLKKGYVLVTAPQGLFEMVADALPQGEPEQSKPEQACVEGEE